MEQHVTDIALIERLARGDRAAMAPLFDRYSRPVFGILVRIVGDRQVAEDLLQETFLRAWLHAASFDAQRGKVLSWLGRIAHNLALNELRTQRRRPVHAAGDQSRDHDDPLATTIDPGPAPADIAWIGIRQAGLSEAMRQLPESERSVVQLYGIGYSQSEIAAHLDQPLGTIKTRMRRALLRLRERLQAEGVEL